MARSTVTIVASGDVAMYEPLRPVVRVRAGDALADARIRVSVRRRAIFGAREIENATLREQTAGPFACDAGETIEREVELPALDGPPSYDGPMAKVVYDLACDLAEGQTTLESAHAPLVLRGPRAGELEAVGYRQAPQETTVTARGDRRERAPVDPEEDNPLAIVVRFLERFAGKRVEISVSPSRARPSDRITATVTLTTRSALSLDSITVTLFAHERREGVQEHEEAIVYTHAERIVERASVEPGTHTYRAELVIPDGAAPSFEVGTMRLEWFVHARVDDGFSSVERSFVISVV